MKNIYKYPLEIDDIQFLRMPKGSEILTVQIQNGSPILWALVDTDNETETRNIEVFGTGNPIPVDMGIERKYIATFQKDWFIGHVFERTS